MWRGVREDNNRQTHIRHHLHLKGQGGLIVILWWNQWNRQPLVSSWQSWKRSRGDKGNFPVRGNIKCVISRHKGKTAQGTYSEHKSKKDWDSSRETKNNREPSIIKNLVYNLSVFCEAHWSGDFYLTMLREMINHKSLFSPVHNGSVPERKAEKGREGMSSICLPLPVPPLLPRPLHLISSLSLLSVSQAR